MQIGDFQLDIISDGTLRLDGGAMFGVVPKVVWEKVAEPDEKNRILIGLNCLLIRTPKHNILIDTGIGEKWSEKQLSIYAISHPPTILSSLAKLGLKAEDISIVINTHLHFDHAGGNTRFNAKGEILPTFPNAHYYVQHSEYKHACRPHERDKASYLPENWQPLERQLRFTKKTQEIIPGVNVFGVPGHNLDTQLVKITQANTTVIFLADIIPTTAHLPIAWVMGYDLYPVELMKQKKLLIEQAISQNWICIFEHDAKIPAGQIVSNGQNNQVKPIEF
jgi:glyoxylase-like metal-dependent hydrolase (beta-lactamase superfamily II)